MGNVCEIWGLKTKRNNNLSISHLAMSLGLMFCVSRKGGVRGGGWVHPKGANSMDFAPWLALGRPFLSFLA